jgi:hypothetical protein
MFIDKYSTRLEAANCVDCLLTGMWACKSPASNAGFDASTSRAQILSI